MVWKEAIGERVHTDSGFYTMERACQSNQQGSTGQGNVCATTVQPFASKE